MQSLPQWVAVDNRSPTSEIRHEERLRAAVHCGTIWKNNSHLEPLHCHPPLGDGPERVGQRPNGELQRGEDREDGEGLRGRQREAGATEI